MNNKRFSIRDRLGSFRFAFNGLKPLFTTEHNSRIHALIAFCAIIAGLLLRISRQEWIAIVIVIGFVIAMEAVNSAIEKLADYVTPEEHEQIKKVKDLAAAGVLISSLTALIVGLIIFIPAIIRICSA